MKIPHLPLQFQPKLVQLDLPCDEVLLNEVETELKAKAAADEFKCFGYFPGMQSKADLEYSLPACEKFAEVLGRLTVENKAFDFSFLRMSLIQQQGLASYHVDSDPSAALTGDVKMVEQHLIWRLLLNLNVAHHRNTAYLDVDVSAVELTNTNGYIHLAETAVPEDRRKHVTIPARKGLTVSAALFCASRVLHAGQDDEFGHFVAGYGKEEG